MDAYEFYWRDPIKGYRLTGVLPEKRKNPARISRESVINLAKELLGDNVDANEIFYVKITKDEMQVYSSLSISLQTAERTF